MATDRDASPQTCEVCGEALDTDGFDTSGSLYCDDAQTTLHDERG